MERSVTNAAMTLTVDLRPRPALRRGLQGLLRREHLRRPAAAADAAAELHVGARHELRARQAHRLQRHLRRRHAGQARLRRAGGRRARSWSPREQIDGRRRPALPGGYQQHKTINEYYKRLGASAPIKSLAEEVADNQANAHEALKFGNNSHVNALAAEVAPGGPNETAYRAAMPIRRAAQHKAINDMMNNETPDDPSDDFIAILGSVPARRRRRARRRSRSRWATARPSGARVSVSIHGNAYSERNLIGVAYVIEQATKLRQKASLLNPSMYRCAKTIPAPPFASRGGCNPDYPSTMAMVGGAAPDAALLAGDGVREVAAGADDRGHADARRRWSRPTWRGSRARTPRARRSRPCASLNADAVADAKALDADALRAAGTVRGPLHGIPVLRRRLHRRAAACRRRRARSRCRSRCRPPTPRWSRSSRRRERSFSARPTCPSSAACSTPTCPRATRRWAARCCCPRTPTRPSPAPSAGSAAATAAGLAALTVGLETSTDTAQLIAPAGVAGVVGAEADGRPGRRRGRVRDREVPGRGRADHAHRLRRGDLARGAGRRLLRRGALALAGGQEDRRHEQRPRRRTRPRSRRSRASARRRRSRPSARRARTRRASSRASTSATSTRSWPAAPAARSRCRRSSTTTPPTRSRASSTSRAS